MLWLYVTLVSLAQLAGYLALHRRMATLEAVKDDREPAKVVRLIPRAK